MNTVSKSDILAALTREREKVSRDWIDAVVESSRGRISSAEAERLLLPMLEALYAGMEQAGFDSSHQAFDELRAMLAEFAQARARQGFTPSETTIAVFALRDALIADLADGGASAADLRAFSNFMDGFGMITFETFAKARESVIAQQHEQLLELSTPVIKLWEGIVAVPLVGTLDSARTQIVMESLLQTLVTTGSEHAIIDITGVPAVDTQVAQHLLKTVVAARLMGADCVISGIRPQIAQTIVSLGVEFGDIATKATLADALRLTLQRSGLEVRKTARAT